MNYESALRAHNKRVTNPHMVYHTPFYYRARAVARFVTMLVVNAFWVAVFLGIVGGTWFVAASLGEWLSQVTK